jgi:hypothetical protein
VGGRSEEADQGVGRGPGGPPYNGRVLTTLFFVAYQVTFVAGVEFNRDIRPILSDKCFACHGPDAANRKTKMRFDIESGARVAIVPGDPAKSEIVRRISSEDTAVRMPPAYAGREKLSDREIGLVRQWIEQGAPWQMHWSFIPPVRPAVPAARGGGQVRNPIDNFIAARLEREGLHPSAEADRRTLIRRVTFDLTGLPPTPAEVDSFVSDPAPDAFEKVVDRLLASPRYGERMAFQWLEAARYADTNGYQTDGVREMWRWRDWVIDAFNRNMPYDQFTVEQIAGDLLPHPTLDQQIATAFHRNHRTSAEGGIVPEEYRVEYVADRAETTATVWMGLTLGCARCHDHKFDPFSQADFYRLFAYFNNVPEKGLVYNFGNEEPYIKAPTPDQERRLQEMDEGIAAAERQYEALQPALQEAQRKWERTLNRQSAPDWTVTEGLVYRQSAKNAADAVGLEYLDPFTFSAWIKPDSLDGAILSRWEDYFEGQGHFLYLIDGKVRLHITRRFTDIGLRMETVNPVQVGEWQHVVVTYDGKRRGKGVRIYLNGAPQETKILFDELEAPISLDKKIPFRIGAGGGKKFSGAIEEVRVYKAALSPEQVGIVGVKKPVGEIAAIPEELRSKAESDKLAACFLEKFAPKDVRSARQELTSLRRERERFYESIPTVMVMAESAEPRDTFVLKRGAYDNPGEKVTAGVPSILPGPRADWPRNRLGLARWLVDRSNPLTARVTVNRFWQMYFGVGIVKTVNDFGSQGEWPVHQELLDWLATEFMESGWDVKALQKTIVMSGTYRQSSKITPELSQKDPENRLLARGARTRFGPETIRDLALALSGLLVEKVGGPSVKPYQPAGLWQELGGGKGYVQDKGEGLYRRSLYTYWKRTVAPPFMVNFDSPNREVCTVLQGRTNTPLQALNLMNDVTFVEASRKLAERLMLEGGAAADARIDYLYRLVLARPPKAGEKRVMLEALRGFQSSYRADRKSAEEFLKHGDAPRAAGLDAADLAAYTSIASLMLNLDEAVTKE